MSKIEVKDPLS